MDIENELIKTIAKYRGREVATFETESIFLLRTVWMKSAG